MRKFNGGTHITNTNALLEDFHFNKESYYNSSILLKSNSFTILMLLHYWEDSYITMQRRS